MSTDDLINSLGAIAHVYPHFEGTIFKAIGEIGKSKFSELEKEILQSLFNGWVDAEMRLPGNISYQLVFDFLSENGIDVSKGEKELERFN